MAFIISADDIKKTLPGYDPSRSDKLHRKSARLADRAYEDAIKNRPEETVILMCGGTASGKTEYISAYLSRRKAIVFDGTMPTFEGARIKIRKAQRQNMTVEIHAVTPESLQTAFMAFLNRERKFPPEHFYNTHSSSRKALLEVAKNFTDVKIVIIQSSYLKKPSGLKMQFSITENDEHKSLIEFLQENQYTKDEIKKEVELLWH